MTEFEVGEENDASVVESKATGRGGRKSVASSRGKGRGSRGKASVVTESVAESPVKSKKSAAKKSVTSKAASRRSGRNKVIEGEQESEKANSDDE